MTQSASHKGEADAIEHDTDRRRQPDGRRGYRTFRSGASRTRWQRPTSCSAISNAASTSRRCRATMMPDEVSGYEGFYAPPASGRALLAGGFHCVGNANNQNYGPEQILASNAHLDALGIPHVGHRAQSHRGARAGRRHAQRHALRLPAAHVAVLAEQSRGARSARRRRRDQGVHRVPAGVLQGRHAAAEPSGHAAEDPDVVRSGLPPAVQGRRERAARRSPISSSRRTTWATKATSSISRSRSRTRRSTRARTW